MSKHDAIQPRHVAVAIPYRLTTTGSSSSAPRKQDIEICLVTSRKHHDRWVLPKGGVEKGEDERQSAVRELWEDAGLRSDPQTDTTPPYHFPPIADHKPHKKSPSQDPHSPGFVPRAIYSIHPISFGPSDYEGEADWPERKERQREWVKLIEATNRVEWRRDIAEGLRLWGETLSDGT